MRDTFLRAYLWLQRLMADECGQDLTEYALIVAVMALGTIAGTRSLASGINLAFNTVSSSLSSSLH